MVDYVGGAGNDVFNGGSGADRANGLGGDDTLSGAGGNDRLIGSSGADALEGGAGDDYLSSLNQLDDFGYPSDNSISHDIYADADRLIGGAGDDYIFAGYNDTVDGGTSGSFGDRLFISFMGATTGVQADFRALWQGNALTIGTGTISNIKTVAYLEGSNFDDILVPIDTYYPSFGNVFGRGGNDHLIANYYTGGLYGGTGDDILDATDAGYSPDLSGDEGNDIIIGGDGYENIDGGDGNDDLRGNYGFDRVYGGRGNDKLEGGSFDDYLDGGDGNDIMYGAGDADWLTGGAGNDRLYGDFSLINSGNGLSPSRNDDVLIGGAGADTLQGDWGNDQLYSNDVDGDAGVERDTLIGGDGNDQLWVGYGDDAYGGAGIDTLTINLLGGTEGVHMNVALILSGLAQSVAGGTIADIERITRIDGTNFSDSITNVAPGIVVDGHGGSDLLFAGTAGASLSGGDGDDTLYASTANDILDGGAGQDTVRYGSSLTGVTVDLRITTTQATGGSGSDRLTGIEHLFGSAFNDRLTGNAENNQLIGDAGSDVLDGGLGDDTLDGGSGNDTVSYAQASGAVTVDLFRGTASGAAGNDVLINIESIIGSAFNDRLLGNGNSSRLSGGAGDDTLFAGIGSTVLDGGTGIDTVIFSNQVSAGLGTGTVISGSSTITLIGIENAIGSRFDDMLFGSAGNNVIEGRDGDDRLDGGAGIDTASYASASSGVKVSLAQVSNATGGAGNDQLTNFENLLGSVFNDMLSGNGAANHLIGSDGDDWLDGGLGNDVLDGGAGIDTASFKNAALAVRVNLANTAAQATGAGTDTLIGIENVQGSAFNDMLTGNDQANVLTGGAGNDLLNGGLGDDVLDGGAGIDTASFADAAQAVRVDLAVGYRQLTGVGLDQLVSIENLVGSAYHDVLTGDAQSNILTGGGGNDLLHGGLGNDTLDGGTGIDTASYEGARDRVIIDLALTGPQNSASSGVDTLIGIENLIGTSYNDVLKGSTFSNVITGGLGNDSIDGREGNDRIDGGAGDDILIGGLGNDVLIGGVGIDTTSFADAAQGVRVDLSNEGAQTTGAGTDQFVGIENVIGSAFDDVLTGDVQSNVLTGAAGNDVLNGGLGNDTLNGGIGNDTASYEGARNRVTVDLALTGAQNSASAGVDTLISIENLTGSGHDDLLKGDGQANILSGGLGNDSLDGRAGNDRLDGGAGDDLLVGGLGNDVLVGGGGIDTTSYAEATQAVRVDLAITVAQTTGVGNDTLSGIENVIGSAFDDVLGGDAQSNVLTGGAGNDVLNGGLGNDTLNGGAGVDTASYEGARARVTIDLSLTGAQNSASSGVDTLISIENLVGSGFDDVLKGDGQANIISGGLGNDSIDGGIGNDRIDGGAGNDVLLGGRGNDELTGGAGNDRITGGADADLLTGGAGVDRFIYTDVNDSRVAAADRILDFAAGDVLDLSGIDANFRVTGDQAFSITNAFSRTAGELILRYDPASRTTTLQADVTGDGIADMTILFTGDVTSLTSTWVL